MNPENWKKVKEIFQDALEIESGKRAAFLSDACDGDTEVRREVESMLKAQDPEASFLEKPVMKIFADKAERENGAKVGETLGQYKLVSLIGVGGMGEVYRARDVALQRDVAIKILPASISNDADRLRRFEQEARSLGQLNHPNILAIYAVGQENGAPFVVSELLEGETLREKLNEARLVPRKALDYARQIARGLAAAHEKAIVHRDLKPENLFVTNSGHVKILDFGLAKLVNSPAAGEESATLQRNNTRSGMILGTVGYMSPEQVRGGRVDSRSDIFAFGAVLYEMLAGKKAFQGETLFDAMNAIVKEEPPDLSITNSQFSPQLAAIVRRCLEKNPAERFQSAHDLAFALDTLSNSPGLVSEQTLTAPARTSKQTRTKGILPYLAAALVLLAAGLPAAYFSGKKAGEKPVPAFRQITFRNGTVGAARFAPDGQNFLYLANWGGGRRELFSGRLGNPESKALDFQIANGSGILAVSSTGEILFKSPNGNLTRASLSVGAPREILENVSWADWAADGANFAVVRNVGGRNRVEFPAGKVLY
jgi:serine/threonine protein kinase